MPSTRWSPDTCACIILYDADFQGAVFDRDPSTGQEIKCAKHTTSGAKPSDVLAHNQRKNSVANWAVTQGVALATDAVDGATVGFDPNAPATSDPVVIVTNGKLVSTGQRATLVVAATAKFGTGAVTVV